MSRSEWNKQKEKAQKENALGKEKYDRERNRIEEENRRIIESLSGPLFTGIRREEGCRCCEYAFFATAAIESVPTEILVPLKAVKAKVVLDSGITKLDLELTYTNLDDKSPIETTFEFPLES